MYLEDRSMDAIKVSLILGIGITLYYLLLQWPNDVEAYGESLNKYSKMDAENDSEYLLSESLSPLSPLS